MSIFEFLSVFGILFILGMCGIVLNRGNVIILLMSIELMLLSVNLMFLVMSVYFDDIVGEVFALFVLTVAAAESAICLSLLVLYYRIRGQITLDYVNVLRG